MKVLGNMIIGLVLMVGIILFNGWFLDCVYNLGIWSFFDHLGHELPRLEYRYFVLIGVIISCIYTYFKGSVDKGDNKNRIDIEDGKTAVEAVLKVLSSLFNKLLLILILLIVHIVCF
jgi:hypothetical protein